MKIYIREKLITLLKKKLIPYHKAYGLIEEGDVLLFRSHSWYSWFVKSYTNSPYTHVGIASRPNGLIEIVDFHGSTGGGVSHNLAYNVKSQSGEIDVYRPSPIWTRYILTDNELVERDQKEFSPEVAKKITNTMRTMTGLPYGWKRIWWMAKHKLVGLRIFYDPSDLMNDAIDGDIIYPVCSTAVAYSFSKNGFDLIKNRGDNWTEPAHLSLSTNLNELFTLVWDQENDKKFLCG